MISKYSDFKISVDKLIDVLDKDHDINTLNNQEEFNKLSKLKRELCQSLDKKIDEFINNTNEKDLSDDSKKSFIDDFNKIYKKINLNSLLNKIKYDINYKLIEITLNLNKTYNDLKRYDKNGKSKVSKIKKKNIIVNEAL